MYLLCYVGLLIVFFLSVQWFSIFIQLFVLFFVLVFYFFYFFSIMDLFWYLSIAFLNWCAYILLFLIWEGVCRLVWITRMFERYGWLAFGYWLVIVSYYSFSLNNEYVYRNIYFMWLYIYCLFRFNSSWTVLFVLSLRNHRLCFFFDDRVKVIMLD